MTKSHEDHSDFDYFYQKLIEASGVPPEYFGLDDGEYYKKLIEESDLIKKFNAEELAEPSSEEELFRQIQEDEREEWSDGDSPDSKR